MIDEISQLDALIKAKPRNAVAGTSTLVNGIKSELRGLDAILGALQRFDDSGEDGSSGATGRYSVLLTGSNIPALEAQWNGIKKCKSLVSFSQTFSRTPGPGRVGKATKVAAVRRRGLDDTVLVDAVVGHGSEWLRVLGMTERRLLIQMAQSGWDWDAESDSDSEGSGNGNRDSASLKGVGVSDDGDEISILRKARHLVEAARANKCSHAQMRVHLVFTRLEEGRVKEVDHVLNQIRDLGDDAVAVTVDCANSAFNTAPAPPLDAALANLVQRDQLELTPALNLDCTILITLATDIDHTRVPQLDRHRGSVRDQIDDEARNNSCLVSSLYPVLGNRRLVCTAKAAERFRRIALGIGTDDEVRRANILLPPLDGRPPRPREELVAQFQALSIHPVPADLQLPVEVIGPDESDIDVEEAVATGRLPPSARAAAAELSDLNRNIFLYGWASGLTTVSANGRAVKLVARQVEAHRESAAEAAPRTWVLPVTRALVARERPEGVGIGLPPVQDRVV